MRALVLVALGFIVGVVVLVATYPIVLVAAWGLLVFAILAARHHRRYGRQRDEHVGELLGAALVGYLLARRHRHV